jgi:hypothetical protein
MNVSTAALMREREEDVNELSGEHDVTAGMRDDYVYTSREGKVVRVGRKAWPALYKSVSPIVSA